jgi:glycosyltransferase involved in cell wall biosynthesis
MRDIARYLLTARHHPGILPHLPHLAHSCYHRRRSAASAVDALCVHAPEEAQAVTALLDLPPIPSIVAPIGRSDPEFAPVPFDRPTDYLLCVGRIEPLKNQLAILDAAISLGAPVLFVGALNKRHRGYCARFTTAVAQSGELARHVPHLDHRMVNTLYRDARAHVLASWGEVFPLTTVEAVSAGCPVVTTANSYEHHVYGDAAHYCDPGSSASIRDALAAVLAAPRRETVDALRARIPLWTDVVASVAHGYRSLAAQPRGARPLPEPPGPERGRRDDGLQISSTESPWKQT